LHARGARHLFDQKGLLAIECFSHADKIRIIDRQDVNRSPTDGRSANKCCASPLKVFVPGVRARMEQARKFARVWVSPSYVRTFVLIAVQAGQSEIL
jgi:hypothetical protein